MSFGALHLWGKLWGGRSLQQMRPGLSSALSPANVWLDRSQFRVLSLRFLLCESDTELAWLPHRVPVRGLTASGDGLPHPWGRPLQFVGPLSQAQCPSCPPERVEPESLGGVGGTLFPRPWRKGYATTCRALTYPRDSASWVLMES